MRNKKWSLPSLGDSTYFHVPFTLQPFLLMGSWRRGLRGEPCPRAERDGPVPSASLEPFPTLSLRDNVQPSETTLGHLDFSSFQITQRHLKLEAVPSLPGPRCSHVKQGCRKGDMG